MEKKILIHRKSQRYVYLRVPLIAFFSIFILYLIIDFLSHWLIIGSFLKYGFSGNGWWFVFVCAFLVFTYLIFYAASKSLQIGEDEILYLEDDKLIYILGKYKQRVNVKNIYEIHIFVKPMTFVKVIKFKTKNPKEFIDFGGNYAFSLKNWIDPENLIKKGVEIYQILKKINPDVELTRFVPRKYRSNKKALLEVYENGKWVPEEIRPRWGK